MLFNSPEFLFLFLPITLWVYHLVCVAGFKRLSAAWLVAASLAFYGWWEPKYLILIVVSIVLNHLLAIGLERCPDGNPREVYRRNHGAGSTGTYLLFVTFFPQLIAGPIVNYRDMAPQFERIGQGLVSNHLLQGLLVFSVGLFKKVIIADGVAPYSDTVFALSTVLRFLRLFRYGVRPWMHARHSVAKKL